jgi:hypothetical protein
MSVNIRVTGGASGAGRVVVVIMEMFYPGNVKNRSRQCEEVRRTDEPEALADGVGAVNPAADVPGPPGGC